ncbi:hypothetical protein [Deinococcus yunweiensis]|uniref:hypothetical protein n=1 Tax=Deinococcus yunweiensis TaxID=367282 RepID=UPI00398F7FB6
MATKTLPAPGRSTVETKGASTPNPKAIREAAQKYADVRTSELPRADLLRKLGLAR